MAIEFLDKTPFDTEEIPDEGIFEIKSLSRGTKLVYDKSECQQYISALVGFGEEIPPSLTIPERVLLSLVDPDSDEPIGLPRVIGVCGDSKMAWKNLQTIPHRRLQVLPEFAGQGIGTFLTEVSDKVAGVMNREVGFRPSRLNLLIGRQGFVPTKVHIPHDYIDREAEMDVFEVSEEIRPVLIKMLKEYRAMHSEYDLPFAVELERKPNIQDDLSLVEDDTLAAMVVLVQNKEDSKIGQRDFRESWGQMFA